MDLMYITYFEETEEQLQKAEECLIKLELGHSSEDINELFRIAHSIKGSSQMIGYDKIGNLTHKIEDLLDNIRKGKINLDSQILRLCFKGLDYVKKLVESKKTMIDEQYDKEIIEASEKLGEEIDAILKVHSEEKSSSEETASEDGIIHNLKQTIGVAENHIYISVSFSNDTPMVQVLLFMIFNNIKEIGTLIYSNISDNDIYGATASRHISSCVLIMNTNMEASELYPYFEMLYVEKVSIIDITESRLREQAVPNDRKSLDFFEMFFEKIKQLHPILFQNQSSESVELGELLQEQSDKIKDEAARIPFNVMLQEIEQFYEKCLFLLVRKSNPDPELTSIICGKYLRLLEQVYGYVKGKILFKIVKARDHNFWKRLNELVERMDKTIVRKLLIDVSLLKTVDENELRDLIQLKKRLNDYGICLCIIVGIPMNKKLVNIFESIKTIEPFGLFNSELDAVMSE